MSRNLNNDIYKKQIIVIGFVNKYNVSDLFPTL